MNLVTSVVFVPLPDTRSLLPPEGTQRVCKKKKKSGFALPNIRFCGHQMALNMEKNGFLPFPTVVRYDHQRALNVFVQNPSPSRDRFFTTTRRRSTWAYLVKTTIFAHSQDEFLATATGRSECSVKKKCVRFSPFPNGFLATIVFS